MTEQAIAGFIAAIAALGFYAGRATAPTPTRWVADIRVTQESTGEVVSRAMAKSGEPVKMDMGAYPIEFSWVRWEAGE